MHTAFFRRVPGAPLSGFRPLGRLAAWPLVVAGGLLALVPQAQAGEWQLAPSDRLVGKDNCRGSYQYSGTSIAHEDAIVGIPGTGSWGTGPAPAVDSTVIWAGPGVSGSNPMPQASANPSRNKGSARFSGQVRAWFLYVPRQLVDPATGRPVYDAKWNPVPDPNDKPGDKLTVRAHAFGMATASDGGRLAGQPTYPSMSYYMTSSGAYKASVSVNGQSGSSVPDSTGNSATATKDVLLLQSVSTNGALLVAGPWCAFDVKGEVTQDARYNADNIYHTQSNIAGSGTAKGEYSVQADTRSVKLSRGGRDERSELKNGEWHTYGDSIYSAKGRSSSDDQLVVPLDIAVGYSGDWKTTIGGIYYDVTPTWSKAGFLSPYTFGIAGQNEGHCYGYTDYGSATVYRSPLSISPRQYGGSPSGAKEFTTTLTAKDNGDGATATASYHLTLHDPVEGLSEGDITTSYQVTKPYTGADGKVLGWPGLRDANSATIEINDETSTEVGLGLKATADVSAFKDLLGLSAEASYTSTHKFTQTIKTEVPKDIAPGQFKYLIAIHNFIRRHKRFYMFDASGKIPRMVNVDSVGNSISPSVDMYHELIEDTAGQADARWSVSLPGPMDPTTLPHDVAPPAKYDYPSGGSS